MDEDGPVQRLWQAGWTLLQWRDHAAPWSRDPDWDRERAIDALLPGGRDRRRARRARIVARRSRLQEPRGGSRAGRRDCGEPAQEGPLDYDGWESTLVDLSKNRELARHKGGRQAYAPGSRASDILGARAQLIEALGAFQRSRRRRSRGAPARRSRGSRRGVRARPKQAQGALDFLDLLVRARDLVRDDRQCEAELPGALHAPVRRRVPGHRSAAGRAARPAAADESRLDARIRLARGRRPARHALHRRRSEAVDLPLPPRRRRRSIATSANAARGRRRHASCTLQAQLPGVADDPARGQRRVRAGDDGRSGDAAGGIRAAREGPRRPGRTQPSVVALPVPRPYGRREQVTAYAIEDSLPDAVGAFVDVAGQRERLDGHRARPASRPCRSRRATSACCSAASPARQTDMTRPYVRGARGPRHPAPARRRQARSTTAKRWRRCDALTAIEWPDDELSVYATLRGPLFGVGDEELLEYRADALGTLHPFRTGRRDVARAADAGGRRARRAGGAASRAQPRPVADTIARAARRVTRAHVGLALWPAGEQALANVLHLADLARAVRSRRRHLVPRVRRAAARGRRARPRPPEAPIVEEGSDGVRIMTVHKAKGLEFPVVILADITARLRAGRSRRATSIAERPAVRGAPRRAGAAGAASSTRPTSAAREEAEGVRLAYVAATRARDLLVVPAVGDEPVRETGGSIR